jgi:hypothetical protein
MRRVGWLLLLALFVTGCTSYRLWAHGADGTWTVKPPLSEPGVSAEVCLTASRKPMFVRGEAISLYCLKDGVDPREPKGK